MKRAAAILALCVGAAWSSTALATSITRSSSFAYDAATGLITQEVVEPGTPALRLETDTTYDAFGNKTSVVTSGIDIATRGNTTAYDARGQFVTTNTNALGQSETLVFDPKFGKPTSQTGPNGLTTTWSYDTFGRKILEVRADGTRTAYSYQLCPSPCVANASYTVVATPLASDGVTQNGPIGIVYLDSLDREVARDTQGFDGSLVRARRDYDSLGRLMRISRPFSSGGVHEFTYFTYDVLGRVLTKTLPDGSVSQTVYQGLKVTETNANNQTRTVTKNARGDVVSVTDALSHMMTYKYDPLGELLQTTDALGNVVSATYDTRGRKISSSDPDMGTWSYSYDTLGELVSQTDAKSQTTTLAYDKLGRKVQRTEPDMTSRWVYDQAWMGIGRLSAEEITAGPGAGFERSFGYDSLGRPAQVSTSTGDENVYSFWAAYDANGRLSIVTYPSGFVAQYSYNSLGYSNQLSDGTSHQVHWTLNALDAEQHITQQTSGNGVVTTRSFSATTGRLLAVNAGAGNAVQNLSYTYDSLGNLLTRADSNENLSESVTYDALNRMTSATIASNIAPVKNFTFDVLGNLTAKSDVGNYTYPASGPGSSHPHAVSSISGGVISTTFTYDPNGNELTGNGRTTTWTSYNKPASITQGSSTISFLDDPEHQRFQQVTAQGTILYFNGFGAHEELVMGSSWKWNDFLTVGNVMVGVRSMSGGTATTSYFHADHLGSISVITDQSGNVLERLSYDAWGKRRFANGADDPSGSITSQTTRGFTAQEELGVSGLVHLNGRIYDPLLGRMTSADPTVPDPLNAQAWNRYSYVGNDPLTFTDPNGFSWLTNIFHDIATFFRAVFANPLVRAIVQIAITAILTATGTPPFLAAAAGAAIVTGLSGGKLMDVVKAGVIAGVTVLAFQGAGALAQQLGSTDIAKFVLDIAGHAGVGCLSALASGGQCKAGALSAAVSAGANPFIPPASVFGLAISGVAGGLASVAGGAKFENGAITGVFAYLASPQGASRQSEAPPPDVDGLQPSLVSGTDVIQVPTQVASNGELLVPDSLYKTLQDIFSSAPLSGNALKVDLFHTIATGYRAEAVENGNYFFTPSGGFPGFSLLLQYGVTPPGLSTGIVEYLFSLQSWSINHQTYIPNAPISGYTNNWKGQYPPYNGL